MYNYCTYIIVQCTFQRNLNLTKYQCLISGLVVLSICWLAYTIYIGGGQEPRLVGFYDNSYVTDLASTPNSIIPGRGVSGPGSRLRKAEPALLGA